MIATEIRYSVRVLKEQRRSLREISRLLKLSRNTVRRILRERETVASPACGLHTLSRLQDALARGGGNVVRVQQLLAAEGLQVPYSTLTRWVRETGPRRPRPIIAAQQWLAQIIHGARSLEGPSAGIDDSSEIANLVYRGKNGRLRERKKALTILARKRGISNTDISAILHSSRRTTRRYFRIYIESGPSVLFGPTSRHSATQMGDSAKTSHILELLHQNPISFDINRTSWTQQALIQAYKERYNETITRRTVERLIKNAGYGWRKARRTLTSPDPNYQEKVELLSGTLLSLTESELFFFLDEWGPVQVRKRGGKVFSAKYLIPRIPRSEASKGAVALIAALSATTNQMTWTYLTSKDTRSITSLLEILYNQYHAYSKLYVTWDAVSWHNSTALIQWLDQFNEATRRLGAGPVFELVPLPTSAQFLNVIEGVLNGMTRAVINNSDYDSPEAMKVAISRHFSDRNRHFRDNPRRAGKAIWKVDLFHGFDAFRVGDDWG
jgi:transposase